MKKLVFVFFVSLAVMAISACSTPEKRYAREQRKQAEFRAKKEERQREMEGRCTGYGFKPNTTAFSQCLMQLDQAQRQAELALEQRQAQESRCGYARAQGLLAPTRTGSFVESVQRGEDAYNACMAGLPPLRGTNIICQRQGRNGFNCFDQ